MKGAGAHSLFLLLLLLGSHLLSVCQTSSSTAEGYRLFSAVSLDTLESKLNEGAAQGYRLLAASPVRSAGTAVLMDRNTSTYYEYRVIFGTIESKSFEKKLKSAGESGYVVVPGAVFFADSRQASTPTITILEKAPDSRAVDYVVPHGVLFMNHVRKEFQKKQKMGYRAVAAHHSGGLTEAIMVRPRNTNNDDVVLHDFRFVTESLPKFKDPSEVASTSKLNRVLQEQAHEGYRLLDLSVDLDDLASLLMEKDTKIKDSRLLARRNWTEFEGELNRLGGEGFRMYPTLLFELQTRGASDMKPLIIGVVEKFEGAPSYHYRIVGAKQLPAMLEELKKAVDDGYKPVPMALDADVHPDNGDMEFKLVLEKVEELPEGGTQ